jgi:hypothetical protein
MLDAPPPPAAPPLDRLEPGSWTLIMVPLVVCLSMIILALVF